MSSIQAVCVGVITIDTIALVDKYPGEDERVIADEISRAGGGPAAVAAGESTPGHHRRLGFPRPGAALGSTPLIQPLP